MKHTKGILYEYKEICKELDIDSEANRQHIYSCIHEILNSYMETHKRVALYCYGYHTKMLMADFVADIRDIVCIVDNGCYDDMKSGFTVIRDDMLEEYHIDGVIISSFKYKDEIKASMAAAHANIDVLDIYEELKTMNIFLFSEFYSNGPYQVYTKINAINNALEAEDTEDLLIELLKMYVSIKDFRMAIQVCLLLKEKRNNEFIKHILDMLRHIYSHQMRIFAEADKSNVLVLCLDGLRRADFCSSKMGKTYDIVSRRGRVYVNAYSYSTMTFESLVPAFSENSDQRTSYYLKEDVSVNECRFIKKAVEQKRKIFIYGDGCQYIRGKEIQHSGNPQTLTEKLWDMTIDLYRNDSALFYLHELYESHYSFPNPYSKGKIVANGMAMLFDFLPKNGGKLQTDYREQLNDSLKYIDDTLAPFLSNLSFSVLLFADHGNMVLEKNVKLTDIKPIQLTAAEEWIRIPWVMISPAVKPGVDDTLISIMDINSAVISLLDQTNFLPESRRFVKIGRSQIYNPDFLEVYRIMNSEYKGEAFEGFIFEDGCKLIVYANGIRELYDVKSDEIIDEANVVDKRYEEISPLLTIY